MNMLTPPALLTPSNSARSPIASRSLITPITPLTSNGSFNTADHEQLQYKRRVIQRGKWCELADIRLSLMNKFCLSLLFLIHLGSNFWIMEQLYFNNHGLEFFLRILYIYFGLYIVSINYLEKAIDEGRLNKALTRLLSCSSRFYYRDTATQCIQRTNFLIISLPIFMPFVTILMLFDDHNRNSFRYWYQVYMIVAELISNSITICMYDDDETTFSILVLVSMCAAMLYLSLLKIKFDEITTSYKVVSIHFLFEWILFLYYLLIVSLVITHQSIDDKYFIISYTAAINFIFPHVPFILHYLFKKYFTSYSNTHNKPEIVWILSSCDPDDDNINCEDRMIRMYCLLHAYYHYDYDHQSSVENTTNLNGILIKKHKRNSLECYGYYFDFIAIPRLKKKMRYMNEVIGNNAICIQSSCNTCSTYIMMIIGLSSVYCYLFPLFWFIYVYIYDNNAHGMKFETFEIAYEWFTSHYNNYEHLLLFILTLFYFVFLVLLISFSIRTKNQQPLYWHYILKIVQNTNCRSPNMKKLKKDYQRLCVVKVLSECYNFIPVSVGSIILSYLY